MSIQKPEEGDQSKASQAKSTITKYRIVDSIKASDHYKGLSPPVFAFYKILGLVLCTVFACLYYLSPLFSAFIPCWIIISRFSTLSITVTCVWVALALVPIGPNNYPNSRFYRSVPLYFDAVSHFEQPLDAYSHHSKPLIYLCFPHGTISFGGWSLGALSCYRPFVSAVVDVLLVMPLLRQFFIGFNICSGSRSSLRKQLYDYKRDVVLYPGGMAELFMSHPDREELYFNKRKGCIKLAMETGADVVVCYLFGNTQLYHLWASEAFAKVSRSLRSSITLFWGRFGLIPYKTQLITVSSTIIQLPDYSSKPNEITPEVLNEQHAFVKSEIERIYTTYCHLHPLYANKPLRIY